MWVSNIFRALSSLAHSSSPLILPCVVEDDVDTAKCLTLEELQRSRHAVQFDDDDTGGLVLANEVR